ncbi:hypothetical protein LCGC14_3026620 [marine sediment metagenome]|uniref:Uncharacterized protein n=1 Tax=marine sediment metagenome TaxID=412755 RepID=A0A0F8WTH9_9ZZZZ
MKAGPIFPYSSYPVTNGKVFPNFHGTGNREGLGVMADLDDDAIWRLAFRIPPAVPALGDAKLRLSVLADVSASPYFPMDAHIEPKWASVAVEGARIPLDGGAGSWTKDGFIYYYPTNLTNEPAVLYFNSDPSIRVATEGDLTASNHWWWGDTGGEVGFDTVYIRSAVSGFPDDLVDGAYTIAGEGETPN